MIHQMLYQNTKYYNITFRQATSSKLGACEMIITVLNKAKGQALRRVLLISWHQVVNLTIKFHPTKLFKFPP